MRRALIAISSVLLGACASLVHIDERFVDVDGAPDATDAKHAPADVNVIDAGAIDAPEGGASNAGDASLGPDAHAPIKPRVMVHGAFADFDGDGRADYAEHRPSDGAFRVFRNDGSGAFVATGAGGATCVAEQSHPSACDVMIADFTGDGFADYADHDPTSGAFRVHRNLHDGTFDTAVWGRGATCTTDDSATGPCELYVGDFTGDGFADYLDREPSTGNAWVHENMRDGTFHGTGINWAFFLTPGRWDDPQNDLLVADFDGDGWCDWAAHKRDSGALAVHVNLHDGTFSSDANVWASGHTCGDADASAPCDVVVGDFDGDRFADFGALLVDDGSLVVRRSSTTPPDLTEPIDPVVARATICKGQSDCEILGDRLVPLW